MSSTSTPLLQLSSLTKRYHGTRTNALDKVSLSVSAGEVYGFLGANGAGKSTAIRTILNFIQPSEGNAAICGLDSVKESVAAKRHVGYLAGEVALYPKLTGHELLTFLQQLQPLKDKAYLDRLSSEFQVQLHKPIGALSKGNRQKVGIIQALMHQPDILILDEPTSGLDPLMQEVFFDHIKEAKKRGGAVFLSSHNLSEVQRMCDHVGIIRDGKLVVEKRVDELISANTSRYTVTFKDGVPKDLGTYAKIVSTKKHLAVIEATTELPKLLSFLGSQPVVSLVSEQIDLEDEFLQFYGEKQA